MHMPSLPQLLIILAIILLLFGGKRVAELAKGLGSGVKNFKDAVKESEENSKDAKEEAKVIEKPRAKRATSKKPTAKAKTAKTTKKA